MPYDGVLWEIYTEEGAYIAPNQSVAKVYSSRVMKLTASVLSKEAASLSEGLEADVTYADGTKGTATLAFISRTASQQADVSFTVVKAAGSRLYQEWKPVILLSPIHIMIISRKESGLLPYYSKKLQ